MSGNGAGLSAVNLHSKKDDFKATPEEMKMITDKMKDPEFMKLFHEYAQTLQDPKYREEEMEYLKQVEREARDGGDHTFDFVFPKATWCVELKQPDSKVNGKKCFLNVCSSDKIDPYEEQTTNDRMGSNWHVPVSVSEARQETFEGKNVEVIDAVFHPKTLALSARSDKFMCFLVEIAVENLNAGYKRSFGFEFRRLSSPLSIGDPKNQTVKRKVGQSAFPKDTTTPTSLGPIKVAPEATAKAAAAAMEAQTKPNPTPASKPAAPPAPTEKLPKVTIAHKGEVDLTDAWNWKTSDKRIGIPKELIVKMEMVGVKSAAVLDIDVRDTYIQIERSSEHPYFGTVSLPFTVESTPKSAKFEKSKAILTLGLAVVPPPRPAEATPPAAEAAPASEESSAANRSESPTSSSHASQTASPTSESKVASSASPTASATAASTSETTEPSIEDELRELEREEAAIRSKATSRPEQTAASSSSSSPKRVDAIPKPMNSAQLGTKEEKKDVQGGAPAASVQSTTSPQKEKDASPTTNAKFDHLDDDRAAQLKAMLERARKEREEVEEKEEKLTGKVKSREPTPTSTPSKAEVKAKAKKEEGATSKAAHADPVNLDLDKDLSPSASSSAASPSASATGLKEDEVVDLTSKQREWLEGVKKTQAEEELRRQMEEEEAEIKRRIAKAEKEAELEREAKRKAKEQQKKIHAEKEAERLAAVLAEKRKELPLNSHHILAIN